MLVQESAVLLLGHLQGLEALSVHEVKLCVDRLVFGLSLERDILDADEVELERVQLFAIELAEKRLLAFDRKL